MRIVWSEVPAFVAALQQETLERDVPFFLGEESVAGLPCLSFSPYHLLILTHSGCPFINGGFPEGAAVARFLWVVAPDFRFVGPHASWTDRRARSRRLRACRKLNYVNTVRAIETYLSDSFADAPGGGDGSGSCSNFSWVAGLIDVLASEYGWEEQTILRIPFKRLWQYLRAIRARHDSDALFINTRTDRARREHFTRLVNGDNPNLKDN